MEISEAAFAMIVFAALIIGGIMGAGVIGCCAAVFGSVAVKAYANPPHIY